MKINNDNFTHENNKTILHILFMNNTVNNNKYHLLAALRIKQFCINCLYITTRGFSWEMRVSNSYNDKFLI